MILNIFLILIIFTYGIVIGSFLNVCIYRIPLHESIALTRSHCMNCQSTLQKKDLIPVFSYIALKGRCRNCGTKISIQYPIIEFVNGLLYLVIFINRGLPFITDRTIEFHFTTILYCLAASTLLVLSVIDFRIYEIPIGINYFLLVIGLIRVGLDYKNWSLYLIGFFIISTLLYLLYLFSKGKAIGGGDIKLMAVGGLLLGWKGILLAFVLGCIIGSVIHLIRIKISHADHVLAMGPYLSIGIFIAMLYGDQLWSWYLRVLY